MTFIEFAGKESAGFAPVRTLYANGENASTSTPCAISLHLEIYKLEYRSSAIEKNVQIAD
jgi:hypothetical protein